MPFLAGQTLTAQDLNDVTDPPLAYLRQVVAQPIPATAFTAVTFTAEDLDSHNGHSTTTNTSRYVCMRAGVYEVAGGVAFAPNTTGYRIPAIARNGTIIPGSRVNALALPSGVVASIAARTIKVRLALGDYVELLAYQDSGGALNTDVSDVGMQSTMSVRYDAP